MTDAAEILATGERVLVVDWPAAGGAAVGRGEGPRPRCEGGLHQSGLTSADGSDPTACWLPEEAAREARAVVKAAGLLFVHDLYIADAVRRL